MMETAMVEDGGRRPKANDRQDLVYIKSVMFYCQLESTAHESLQITTEDERECGGLSCPAAEPG